MEYIKYLPKNSISRWTGQFAQREEPKWLVESVKNWFINRYRLNMLEAEYEADHYKSLGALFTRRLKEGVRQLDEAEIIHPCDGKLTQVGRIQDGQIIQTKGIKYSVNNFLKDPKASETFKNGSYFTYYLCPTDYHRVHCPMGAKLSLVTHIPGELWPVNPWSVENISQLFAVNERVVFHLDTALGPVALVMVGATNVGKIEVAFDESIHTNTKSSNKAPKKKRYPEALDLQKGSELGIFHMGSSVVLIFPENALTSLPKPGSVRVGNSMNKTF